MAYITVNTSGTFPSLILSTDITGFNQANGYFGANANADTLLNVTCLQDVTITNSTGIFSWTDFCSASVNKVTTPSDNEISTNIVIQSDDWFGNTGNSVVANSALNLGVSGLSETRKKVAFRVQMNDSANANSAVANGVYWYAGEGYISSLAPTVSPDSPVWVSPLTIAVDGDMTSGTGP